MVHTEKVEQPVEHQDSDLLINAVSVPARLICSPLDRDGDFAEELVRSRLWKGDHIGWVIVGQELPVEAPQFLIVGKETAETAAVGHCLLEM
jgi:hypothetical protein